MSNYIVQNGICDFIKMSQVDYSIHISNIQNTKHLRSLGAMMTHR